MAIILDGTTGITTPLVSTPGVSANTNLSYTGTLTGGTGVVNIGSGQVYKDASGNLLLGTTTSSGLSTGQLQLGTTSAAGSAVQMLSSTTGTSGVYFGDGTTGDARYRGAVEYDNSGDSLRFYSTSAERARIDSSGNLLVGTTSAVAKLTVVTTTASGAAITFDGNVGNGLNFKTTYASATGGTYITFSNSAGNATGNISQTGTTTVAYATSSDYRLKENILPMTGALAKVAQLKPVTYKWKSDGSNSQGFIAHELQEVVPECVVGEKDAVETYTNEDGNEATRPVYQGIDTSFLVATLTAAIQEQQALITALTTRITALEGAAA